MPLGNNILEGRCALVTGASRGIGRAIAHLLAQHGATVAVHFGSDEESARETLQGLAGSGHIILMADLAHPAAAAELPSRCVEAFGRLDIVVNNAGIYVLHDVLAAEDPEWANTWDRTLAINLTAPAMIMRSAAPLLAKTGGGHMVNITSRGAFRGEPEAPAYGAAKAGLNSLTQSLALKLAPKNIHLVAVAPGFVLTDMTTAYLDGPGGDAIRAQSPLNRTATADEVAQIVLLAVSGQADAMTGGIIDVNAGSYLRS